MKRIRALVFFAIVVLGGCGHPDALLGTDIVMTIVGGRIRYHNGEIVR